MRILITGGTGTIGRRIVADRISHGDEIVVVSRDARKARGALPARGVDVVEGNPMSAGPWQGRVGECDAVIHLAGAGVADRRWTKAYKKLVFDSRVESTHRVVEAIDAARRRPRVLVSASATGYYGDTGDRTVDESAPAGDDYLARLAAAWEAAAAGASGGGTRVVTLRTGFVLDERGGALPRLVPVFKLMLGGPLGSGRQYVPWVHRDDVLGLADLALRTDRLDGPLNVVAPRPVTSREFARALGGVLGRPAFMPVPGPLLRLAMGEIARYALFSQRVAPQRALASGYKFVHPTLRPALESLLRR